MKIKYYKPAIASMSLGCKNLVSTNQATTVGAYQSVEGTSYSTLNLSRYSSDYYAPSVNNLSTYKGYTAYASSEVETNFDIDDYATPSDFTDLTINKTETITLYGISYILEITNNGSEAVTVNSFKFTKNLYPSGSQAKTCLMSVVYLDSPVTIAVGATKTVTVNFSFYNS